MYNVLSQVLEKDYALYHGDGVEILQNLPDECIHLSVFSPPFLSLYAYTPTERDLGNSQNDSDFMEHFEYIVEQLLRITHSGRNAAVHVADVPARKVHDGYIGLKDFSGDVIRLFEKVGWIYSARIPIDKNQQAQAIRTRSHQLTMSQKDKDQSWLRPALPDYILKFRKPGENLVPVRGEMGAIGLKDASGKQIRYGDEWIELANPTWPGDEIVSIVKHSYARLTNLYREINDRMVLHNQMLSSPNVLAAISASAKTIADLKRRIMAFAGNGRYPQHDDRCADTGAHATWYGIEESDTLQGWQKARESRDELHVCPLQLQTIERCVRLWSNPNEIVLDPFCGIGSTGYVSLLHERKFIGCELKDSYYNAAVNNLRRGQAESQQVDLFDFAGVEVKR
jgi:DNA modification methylase